MASGRGRFLRRGGALGAGMLAALSVTASLAPGAGADSTFCPPGAGAGQCALPTDINSLRGLAFDSETGRLYVADKNNNRVDVFSEAGAFLFAFGWKVNATTPEEKLQTCTTASGCLKGSEGPGAGQFKKADRIAVDNEPASASRHDIYVADEANHRVEKFDPTGAFLWSVGSEGEIEGQLKTGISVGVGPGGTVYVLDNLPVGGGGLTFKHRLQRFGPSGAEISPQCLFFEGGRAAALAVRPDGGFWVANAQEGESIRRYDTACAQQGAAIGTGVETNLLALDEAGTLFAAQRENAFRVVSAYGPTGQILRRFGYGKIPISHRPEGLAARSGGGPGGGGLFLALGDNGLATTSIDRLQYPGSAVNDLPVPGPVAAGVEVEKVGSAKAKATVEINPEGKATQVHVEYLSEADYAAQGNSFTGPDTKSTAPEPLGAAGFDLGTVGDVLIGCADPAVEIEEADSACLQPETGYRFRVVATNADGGGEGTLEGEPFTTGPPIEVGDVYATDPGTDTARLAAQVNPEGIPATGFFEYVDDAHFQASGFAEARKAPDVDHGQAPLDFGGAEEGLTTRSVSLYPLQAGTTYHYRLVADNPVIAPIVGTTHLVRTFRPPASGPCPNDASRIGAGALLPDCRAYEMVSPLDKEGGDIRVLKANLEVPAVLEQAADSGGALAYGSARSFGGSPSGPYTSQYVARRVEGSGWETHPIDPPRGRPLVGSGAQRDTEFRAFSPDLCEGWLTTFAEFPDAPAGTVAKYSNLYRRSDRLCGAEGYEALAPLKAPPVITGGSFGLALQGVSAEGTHAIFTANGRLAAGGDAGGARQLYESVGGGALRLVCILPGGGAVSGDCTAGSNVLDGAPGVESGAISEDGQRIFWSAPGTGEGKLYARTGGTQTVAVSAAGEEAAGTTKSWFWGASADGARAVFSTGDLPNGQARLYSFDVDGAGTAAQKTHLVAEGVYGVMGMSDDARRVYFASGKALAAGAIAGQPNLYLYQEGAGIGLVATLAGADLVPDVSNEAFRKRTPRVTPDGLHAAFASLAAPTGYDNKGAAGGAPTRELYLYDATTQKLLCASCNPTGARPAGPASIPPFETGMHAARVLADDGSRLYFQSADRLAARDSNGREDVYQWERPGTGRCSGESTDFSVTAEGCVSLISSGQDPDDARFVEADPTGDNVFFATVESLLPQDYGLFDIYDARVEGGLPVPPPPQPPCEGDACHAQIAAPEVKGAASSAYHPPEEGRGRCPAGRHSVKKKGRRRCVAKHRRHHRRAGRTGRRAGR